MEGAEFVYRFYKRQNTASAPTPSAGIIIINSMFPLDNKPANIKLFTSNKR